MVIEITQDEFKRYLEVQKEGSYNMLLDGRARQATGLSQKKYWRIIDNYGDLMEEYRETYDEIMNYPQAKARINRK